MRSHRPQPHLDIPQGARPPEAPGSISPFEFELNGPNDAESVNPWTESVADLSPNTPQPGSLRPYPSMTRPLSSYESPTTFMPFPFPELHRSTSNRSTLQGHRSTKSDLGSGLSSRSSGRLSMSSSSDEYDPQFAPPAAPSVDGLSAELSNLTLDSDEDLRRFQTGELDEKDEEWHRLVPPEALEALGQREVHRQSVLFEVVKSEREYVSDLELVREVFIDPLLSANPPVMLEERARGFVKEVFFNLGEILAHHQRMLGGLFARQRDQHPLIQSVSDVILDTCLLFGEEYETYIKHYPIAESRHRSELRRNQNYKDFIQQCSQHPRIRKRDLVTFISRPVTRLPRLRLLLEQVLKLTDDDHPDKESIPLILAILSDFIRSAQPGIEAAEGKVKFWNLCESLVFYRGEIIDMDLYDKSRTLVYQGLLTRRQRSETDWHGWDDFHVALLDNYLLLTKAEPQRGMLDRHHIISRPIPLDYLRMGAWSLAPENRRERSEEGGLLDALRFNFRPMYPFTVYHASSKSSRHYTLYADSEASRTRWRKALNEAMSLHKARQEANMWFVPFVLNDGFFRTISSTRPYISGLKFTGRIKCATAFVHGGKKYLVVGCTSGIYASMNRSGTPLQFRKVLNLMAPTSMVAIQQFNKFVVHWEANLFSFSLDILARVATDHAQMEGLDASMEKLNTSNENVTFFKAGRLGNRTMVLYSSKTLLQFHIHALEAVNPETHLMSPRRQRPGEKSLSFRAFSGPIYIPKDAHDVIFLAKTVAVCGERGILVVDPTNLVNSNVAGVPDWSGAYANIPMQTLKQRCDAARPLGLVKCDSTELLVIYDDLGCYISKHGEPRRQSGFLRWETRAVSYAQRHDHVLLFSENFIEIRHINSGKLVQVIEGQEIRLISAGMRSEDPLLVATKGDQDDEGGVSEKVIELVQTSELRTPRSSGRENIDQTVWDEWDMA